jgi:hypothetical protein
MPGAVVVPGAWLRVVMEGAVSGLAPAAASLVFF